MLVNLSKQLFEDLDAAISNHTGAEKGILAQLLPRKELQALMEATLGRLNLVTRQEFDAQTAVLQRTREKLETLETELASLQATIERSTGTEAVVKN